MRGGQLGRGGADASYPTETVYGLGARLGAEEIAAIRSLKGRSGRKPFLVLLPDAGEGQRMGLEWSPEARRLAEALWPGPLTLILSDPAARQPEGVRGPTGGVAIRVSPDAFVRELMEVWRRPLLSTSANPAGRRPAKTAEGVREAFGDREDDRLWVVDGGPRVLSPPSTLVDCTRTPPVRLRAGPIEWGTLRGVVPEIEDASNGWEGPDD